MLHALLNVYALGSVSLRTKVVCRRVVRTSWSQEKTVGRYPPQFNLACLRILHVCTFLLYSHHPCNLYVYMHVST
uniref:Predicted protein n=1 Tax=Hordeum vulgare subsp. vulgare TaxID=112509 RepID=F2DTC8_HORVV|nr:predicted protein [Hordeum vulgare subsp. vulgare]